MLDALSMFSDASPGDPRARHRNSSGLIRKATVNLQIAPVMMGST
jgi:hypothetical protein